jgi:aminoglycoside phosphotransferase (APT) family kinase protein
LSVEEGWQRRFAVAELDPAAASALLGQHVRSLRLLSGGLRNTNYRVELASGPAVLRLYTAEAAACARETRLLELLLPIIPVPRVVDRRCDANPPWALLEFVDGVRFDRQPSEDLATSAFDAGHVLARIHAFPLEKAAHVDLYRYVGGGYGFVEFIESTLQSGVLPAQLGPERTRLLRQIVREHAAAVGAQNVTLQHSDYKPWNLLVRDGRLAAVLDWEFAFAGGRLNDIANFLRYSERQPAVYQSEFVRGYLEGGGTLPADWFRLARLTDLMALCEFLSRPEVEPAVASDIVPLIEQTIDLFTSHGGAIADTPRT